MAPDGVEFGHALRQRRRAVGLSLARLADEAGVSIVQVGRWERGEAEPTSDVIGRLRDPLQLSDAEAALWSVSLDPPPPPPLNATEVSIEFVIEDAPPEEWLPPRQRVRPPNLDRKALTGGTRSRRHLQMAEGADGRGPSDLFAPGSPHNDRVRENLRKGVERRARRSAQRRERREDRQARQEAVRSAAESLGEGALAIPTRSSGRSGYEPRGFTPDSHLEQYLSIANTGAAFPIPDRPNASKTYPYSDGPPTLTKDWPRYWLRTFMLLLVLGILAGVLAWSMFQLQDGWTAVIDLFRSKTVEEPIGELTDALGMFWL